MNMEFVLGRTPIFVKTTVISIAETGAERAFPIAVLDSSFIPPTAAVDTVASKE